YYVATEDLDDDGQHEVVVISRAPSLCDAQGCAVVVLRKAGSGAQILFSGKVAIAKSYAITAEKVDGYRAIAALDAAGSIAMDPRATGKEAGRQLGFAMRSSRQGDAAAASRDRPPSGAAQAPVAARGSAIEMVELAKLLLLPNDAPGNAGDWALDAGKWTP